MAGRSPLTRSSIEAPARICTRLSRSRRALDLEAQRLLVEAHHAGQVAHPQHDMVDPFDMESHGV